MARGVVSRRPHDDGEVTRRWEFGVHLLVQLSVELFEFCEDLVGSGCEVVGVW